MSTHYRRVSVAEQDARVDRSAQAPEQGAAIRAESSSPLEAMVVETINALAAKGISADDMAPLLQLKDALRSVSESVPGSGPPSQRDDEPASERLLARASVIMDLLVQGGATLEQAAQRIARQLLASGVQLPESGGDSRGWRRLLNWRVRLQHRVVSAGAQKEYERFKQEIAAIPPNERLARALNEKLWDRRWSLER